MWKTHFTQKLGIKYPIIQAPMAGGATTPELVAAVSNAGGLGSLAAGYMAADEIRQAIHKIRELTSYPFGVNLFIPEPHKAIPTEIVKACADINFCCRELHITIEPPSAPYAPLFEEQVAVIIEEKVPVFSFTFGVLKPKFITQLQKNHTVLFGTATTVNEALLLESQGIDFIVAQGTEAGGHRGTFLGNAEDVLTPLNDLVTQIMHRVKTPVIAAGGIMNGQGITQVLQAGACAAQMGTAFLTCVESGISDIYKQILLDQTTDNTILTRAFSGKLARGIRNKFINCMHAKKPTVLAYPIQNALTTSMRKAAIKQGNYNFMSLFAGQSVAMCRHIPAAELVKNLVTEVEGKSSL